MARKKGITDKQRRFVEEYFIDYNQKAAAIRAGYSPRSASAIAAELMANPDIQDIIEYRKSVLSARIGVSVERIRTELAAMAFVNAKNFIKKDANGNEVFKDIHEMSEFDSAAIQEITVTKNKNGTTTKFKLASKDKPIELLGKMEGIFKENVSIEINANRAQSIKKARERVRNGQVSRDNT